MTQQSSSVHPSLINLSIQCIIILFFMKIKTKKARYIITRQNNSSDLAENILYEYSENSQNRIFSKSFAYGLMLPVNQESSSLSNWAENQVSLDPKSPIKQSITDMPLSKQTQRMKQRYKPNLQIQQSCSFQRLNNKQKRGTFYGGSNRERANTTRTRCIVNVVSPKFNDQKLQAKIQFINTNSSGFYNPMRQTIRQRKGLVIKRVRRGSIKHHATKSEQKNVAIEDQSIDTVKQKEKSKNLKLYSEIQIKFNDSSVDCSSSYPKNHSKQAKSVRISRLLAYKNSNTSRGKNTIKKQRMNDQIYRRINQFQSLQQVKTLRSLINRQKFQKVSVNRNNSNDIHF